MVNKQVFVLKCLWKNKTMVQTIILHKFHATYDALSIAFYTKLTHPNWSTSVQNVADQVLENKETVYVEGNYIPAVAQATSTNRLEIREYTICAFHFS